jgi:type III restriction enzyme
MLRELDYQARVLETLETYLDALTDEKGKSDKIAALIAAQPDLGIPQRDFSAETWKRMKAEGKLPASRAAIDYSPRHDGIAIVSFVGIKNGMGGRPRARKRVQNERVGIT